MSRELREAIAATLYAPDEPDLWADADPEGRRDCLDLFWPCPTVRAIDGAET